MEEIAVYLKQILEELGDWTKPESHVIFLCPDRLTARVIYKYIKDNQGKLAANLRTGGQYQVAFYSSSTLFLAYSKYTLNKCRGLNHPIVSVGTLPADLEDQVYSMRYRYSRSIGNNLKVFNSELER